MKTKTNLEEVFAVSFNGNEFPIDFQTCLALAVPLLILAVIACAIFRFHKINKRVQRH